MARGHRFWHFRGLGGEPLRVQRVGDPRASDEEPLATPTALGYLDHWLLDGRERDALLDVYAAEAGPLSIERWGVDDVVAELVGPALRRAIEAGDLVVLEPGSSAAAGPPVVIPVAPPTPARRPSLPVTPRTFIEIELLEADGTPVPGAAYRVTLPDGSVKTGTLDRQGLARFDGIDPGECDIEITSIDGREWGGRRGLGAAI